MSIRRNCWDFHECRLMGKCPASTDKRLDGVHKGINAGRACWVLMGTLCDTAHPGMNCETCMFYRSVVRLEGPGFKFSEVLNDQKWPDS